MCMGLGTTPRLHCPGEKSPSTLLFTHLGLLNPCLLKNSAVTSISPALNYVLHLSDAWSRSLCSCHSEIHQSDVIPLLPQQCNSAALTVLMDPLSSSCSWVWARLTGRGKSGRELATREQGPVRMSFMRKKTETKQNSKTNQKITRNIILQNQA